MNDSHPDTDWHTPDLARLKKRGLWIAIPFLAVCVGMGIWLTGAR